MTLFLAWRGRSRNMKFIAVIIEEKSGTWNYSNGKVVIYWIFPADKVRCSEKYQNVMYNLYKLQLIHTPVKKRVLERVLQRVVDIIRSETLGRRLASTKSLAKSLVESLTKSLAETLSETLVETFGETSRSPSVSPESRIGLYAWLSARLSPRLVFFLRGHRIKIGLAYVNS